MKFCTTISIFLILCSTVFAQNNGAYNCTIKDVLIDNKVSDKIVRIKSDSESYICHDGISRQACKEKAKDNLRRKVIAETGLNIQSKVRIEESLSLNSKEENSYDTNMKINTDNDINSKIEGEIDCKFIESKTERSTYSWLARSGAVITGGLTFYQFTLKNEALNEASNLEKKASSTSVTSTKTSYQNQAKDKRDEAAQLEQQQNLFLGITVSLVLLDLLFFGLDYQDDQRWDQNVSLIPEYHQFKTKLTFAYKIDF